MKVDWRGVIPAITTPFNQDSSIDHEFFARHARWMVEAGCVGIVPFGSLGEAATLTTAEKLDGIATLARELDGVAPVIPAVSALSTQEAVEFTLAAEAAGASGFMVLPPYVYSSDWREMKAHVAAILNATSLPCMLYNNPLAYKTDFSPEQIAEWADTLQAGIDRHAGIRDALAELSSGDETEQTQWEQIVTGSEGELEILRHRLAVLQTGDWEQISQDFLTDDGTQDPPVDALDALDLRSTDCEWIYLPTTVEEGSEEFVRAATTACTHISNRRSTTGFRTDAEADFDIFLTVFSEGDPAEVSEETVDAVERVHQEWERTVEDLEAVDASGAPDRDAWERSLQRVRERAHLTGDRAGALRAADADTISAAYGTDRTTSGSLDLEALGLQHRSCAGVSG